MSKIPSNKRSVIIGGHRTSMSLEPEFWAQFQALAKKRGKSINVLATEIDNRKGMSNLSSAARLEILRELTTPAEPAAPVAVAA